MQQYHTHKYEWGNHADGDHADYVVFGSWGPNGWVEHTRWMIPGTWEE